MLQNLSERDLQMVLSRASARDVRKGVYLFLQGEPARELFILQSGRIRVHEITEKSRDFLVRFVGPGQIFGNQAAIPDANYGAFARCETTCRVWMWTQAALRELLEEVPRLTSNLFAITTRMLHHLRERYRLLATESVEDRIDWALTELANSIGTPQGDAVVIAGQAIQKDIADLASTTPYTVSRALTDHERRGVLTKKGRHILLHVPMTRRGNPNAG